MTDTYNRQRIVSRSFHPTIMHRRQSQQIFLCILVLTVVIVFIYTVGPHTMLFGETFSPVDLRHHHHLLVQNPKRLITATFKGRLGNHLFAYCTLLGVADKNNMTPLVPDYALIWEPFLIPEKMGYIENLPAYVTYYGKKAAFFYPQFFKLNQTDVFLVGYLQSWKYCEHIKERMLKEHLVFKPELQKRAVDYIENAKAERNKQGAVIVGMHVRRGDFVRQKKKGFTAAPVPYIYEAQNYFRRKYKNVLFILCSNDIIWCEDNLDKNEGDFYYTYNSDGLLDLAILANSDHTILTSGSFSWWAGYLCKGEVVYYHGYPEPNTVIGNITNREDYYPPHWIGLGQASSKYKG